VRVFYWPEKKLMAIQWPASIRPSEMNWGIVYNNRAFTSTLSNAQQVVG